jgi:hypothetical protein
MTFNSKNDMQRLNALRIEEEHRRREEEMQTRLSHPRGGEMAQGSSRLHGFAARIRRALRR